MPSWLGPVVLEAGGVRLEPVERGHLAPLCETIAPDTFRYFTSAPAEPSPDALWRHFEARPESPRVIFAVLDAETGDTLGSSSFFDANELHRGLEVGYTWFAPEARGTSANPATKLAMLEHAFETMGALRVQLKTDERNAASRAALAKLGAQEEGHLRKHRRMPDGHMRTTVFFSIVDDEWPEVKRRLLIRLGAG